MKAHELLSDATKWTKGAFARRDDGGACNPADDAACQWCLTGAIYRCYWNEGKLFVANQMIGKVQNHLVEVEKTGAYPHWWNDRHTYEEVVGILRQLDI